MPQVERTTALHAARAELVPQRFGQLFDAINVSARLYDNYLSDEALERAAQRARAPVGLRLPAAPPSSPITPRFELSAPPGQLRASPETLSPAGTAIPEPEPSALHSYLRRQSHAFFVSASLGRSVQQIVIHPLFYWPLLSLTYCLPDKISPGLAAVRIGLGFPVQIAREVGLNWPRQAVGLVREALKLHALAPLAPVGWAVLLARVFECYVGRGVRTQQPALTPETGPSSVNLENFERFGLIGLLTEKPLLMLAGYAVRKNHPHYACALLGAACGVSLVLQGMRLMVVGLIAINMAMCGATGLLLAGIVDVIWLGVHALVMTAKWLAQRGEQTEQALERAQNTIHFGAQAHAANETLEARIVLDERHPQDVRQTADALGFARENPHATSISMRNVMLEQRSRNNSTSSHLSLNMRGVAPANPTGERSPQPIVAHSLRQSRTATPMSRTSLDYDDSRRTSWASSAAHSQIDLGAALHADELLALQAHTPRRRNTQSTTPNDGNLRGEGQRRRRSRLPAQTDIDNAGAATLAAFEYRQTRGQRSLRFSTPSRESRPPREQAPLWTDLAAQRRDDASQSSHSSDNLPSFEGYEDDNIPHTPLEAPTARSSFFRFSDLPPAGGEQLRDHQVRPRPAHSMTTPLHTPQRHALSQLGTL